MTEQEIFDTAVIGVLKQGIASVRDGGACAYRGKNGTKCAVGFLISDEEAEKYDEFDEYGVRDLISSGFLQGFVYYSDLLADLQRAHDKAAHEEEFVGAFYKRAKRVAAAYGLSISSLDDSNAEVGT